MLRYIRRGILRSNPSESAVLSPRNQIMQLEGQTSIARKYLDPIEIDLWHSRLRLPNGASIKFTCQLMAHVPSLSIPYDWP
jgi:hypothetical protein